LSYLAAALCAILLAACTSGVAAAQSAVSGQAGERGFSIVGALDGSFGAEPASVAARFVPVSQFDSPAGANSGGTAAAASRVALIVTVRLQAGWHVYSITQPRGPGGGPQKTKLELVPSPKYRLLAPFSAYPEPTTRIDQEVWKGLELQEHESQVTWYAPVELAAGALAESVEIRGTVDMQVCKEQCIPIKTSFSARQGGDAGDLPLREAASQWPAAIVPLAPPTSRGTFQAPQSVVRIQGKIEPATVRPGETARIILAADVTDDWHVFAYAERDAQIGSKPTLIALQSTWGLPAGRPTTGAPITVDNSVPEFGTMHYYAGPVTWTIEINVPRNAEPGVYPIHGVVGYQACQSRPDGTGVCELPKAARFQGSLHVGEPAANAGAALLTFAAARYPDAAKVAAATATELSPASTGGNNADPPAAVGEDPPRRGGNDDIPALSAANLYDLGLIRLDEPTRSLWHYIAAAFVGGLILNLMPCVLPVIGLKVMSFVEQAGKSRGHALVLNLWYSAGIIFVFIFLGVLAVAIGLSWGGQFGNTAFNVIIAAVVFAMALSLLGVWEVPIPGFFGSGAFQEAAAKEGPLGAFLKGVVTTVLATPCTASFMASAVAWAVTQSAAKSLSVFAALGLGMASPYLVVGAFPELLRFLPKPGRWMETLKQLSGFILLGTVVFILSFIEPAAVVPTVLLLVGVGMACWIVAGTPLTAELRDRLQTWAMAGAVLILFGVASFGWLFPDVMRPRFADGGGRAVAADGWAPFSLARLQRVAVEEGRTVLVDFTANWCAICKFLEQTVLHTETIKQAMADAGVVAMIADHTDEPPEIEQTIRALKSNGVPVIAIFPGGSPYKPIVFRGGYTQQGLVSALEKAAGRRLRGGAVAEAGAVVPPFN
jgi:thiol:disulfide interchange protein